MTDSTFRDDSTCTGDESFGRQITTLQSTLCTIGLTVTLTICFSTAAFEQNLWLKMQTQTLVMSCYGGDSLKMQQLAQKEMTTKSHGATMLMVWTHIHKR